MAQNHRYRAKLNLALSAGRMTTWEWDLRTGSVSLGTGAEQVFGKRCERAADAWASIHEEDRERLREVIRSIADGNGPNSFLCRCIREDLGTSRWIESFWNVDRDDAGAATCVHGLTVDVDDRQRLLEASRAAESRFEMALRGSKVVAWECDEQMRYTWVRNPQLGFKANDFIGRKIGDLLPPEQAGQFIEAAHRVFATGKPETFPVDVVRPEMTHHYVSTIDVRVDEHGRQCGLIGASLNVTDIKSSQLALAREVQRKDAFLATLAHELRNPMAPIRNAVALLRRSAPESTHEYARQVIERQAGHMSRLLDDLLDMSRITRNAIDLRRERVDVRVSVEQALEAADEALRSRGITVNLASAAEPLWIDGDTTRLLQIFGNLIDNAVKYTPAGGEVGLLVERVGRDAVVTVRDTGIGLSADQVGTVFEMFSRARTAGRTDPGGLGIGLAVVKQLVELHGGSVRAESEGIDKGARFVVRIPLDVSAASTPLEDKPPPVVQIKRNCSILVVDDNQDAADTLAGSLRLEGYAVSVAYDGATALDAFENLRPTAILLDIGLPDLSGYEVTSRLRQQGARAKIIAVSGWGQDVDRRQGRDAGFDAHLVKPTHPDEVHQTLQRLLDGATDGRLAS